MNIFYLIMTAIVIIVIIVSLIEIKLNSGDKSIFNADKKEKVALCVSRINDNINFEEAINQVSEIVGKSYIEVRNILDSQAVRDNKKNENNDNAKFLLPVLAVYQTVVKANVVRNKLNDIGIVCTLALTSELSHDDKYNFDYYEC